ncbi:MAG: hypothetical protein KDA96_26440, partial [Planctomycetaceae bacterium]|nr:hypothetical protein [Planctomycetaceae bacterium]
DGVGTNQLIQSGLYDPSSPSVVIPGGGVGERMKDFSDEEYEMFRSAFGQNFLELKQSILKRGQQRLAQWNTDWSSLQGRIRLAELHRERMHNQLELKRGVYEDSQRLFERATITRFEVREAEGACRQAELDVKGAEVQLSDYEAIAPGKSESDPEWFQSRLQEFDAARPELKELKEF